MLLAEAAFRAGAEAALTAAEAERRDAEKRWRNAPSPTPSPTP